MANDNPIDFCRSFQHEACKVWQDMSHAKQFGVPRSEETTTEQLLLNLAMKHKGVGLNVKAYTKKEEAKTGGDWAFWFSARNLGIGVRIQAKRLCSSSGRYKSLFYQSDAQRKKGDSNINQCQTMLTYQDNLVPIYIFYNSDALLNLTSPPRRTYWKLSSFIPEHFGISTTTALSIKQADWGRKNRPYDFFMEPWHCLVCRNNSSTTDRTLPELVSAGLRRLFEKTSGYAEADTDLKEHRISFELTEDSPPDWVSLLLTDDDDRERLTVEMDKSGLRGVAVLEQTGEWLE